MPCAGPVGRAWSVTVRSGAGRSGRRQGKPHGEASASPGMPSLSTLMRPAVRSENLLADRQPQASARRRCSPGSPGRGRTGGKSRAARLAACPGPVSATSAVTHRLPSGACAAAAQRDCPAGRGVVDGVGEQVGEHLGQQPLVAHGQRQRGSHSSVLSAGRGWRPVRAGRRPGRAAAGRCPWARG